MKHPITFFAIWTLAILMLGVSIGARFFERQEMVITIAPPPMPPNAEPYTGVVVYPVANTATDLPTTCNVYTTGTYCSSITAASTIAKAWCTQ